MILLAMNEVYYNTQVYFRRHHMDNLPNDDKIWAAEYRNWLKSQGAVIVEPTMLNLTRNGLGVAPHFDKFGFERQEDATVFALRWS